MTKNSDTYTGKISGNGNPCPFSEFGECPHLTLELIDIQGKVILRKTGLSNKSSINVANLLSGVYLYRLTRDGMVICADKILKNN